MIFTGGNNISFLVIRQGWIHLQRDVESIQTGCKDTCPIATLVKRCCEKIQLTGLGIPYI